MRPALGSSRSATRHTPPAEGETTTVLTAAELAAFLRVSPSAIRQVVRRHGIRPAGRGLNRAQLYRAENAPRFTGEHDRLAPG